MRKSDCHPDRPHHAHGLCKACYDARRWSALGDPAVQTHPCEVCGAPTSLRRRFCSPGCDQQSRLQVYTCATCGIRFTAGLSVSTVRYCSNACRSAARRMRLGMRPRVRCRVCGFAVDLLPIPQDAGGGYLCRCCLDEGLKRAA